MKYTKQYLKKCVDNAANPREKLHEAYKERMKIVIRYAIDQYWDDFHEALGENPDMSSPDIAIWYTQWIDKFVEERFRMG